MVGIDKIIFGYRRIRVREEDCAALANLLLSLGMSARLDADNSFALKERECKALLAAASGKIELYVSEPLGIPGFIKKNRKRYGTAAGLLFAVFTLVFLSGLVWDVRIVGEYSLDEDKIKAELDKAGLSVGSFWHGLDKNAIENRVLLGCEDISWIAINRKGCVAYVQLSEKEGGGKPADEAQYTNIVAACDAVIEEITVMKGVALVKPGDVVRRGDILISGIYPDELGGGFCHADGAVMGSVKETLTVEASRIEEMISEKERRRVKTKINIFGFSLNIFKNYGNYPEPCDIIEEKEDLMLFGKFKLPVKIFREYSVERVSERIVHSDSSLTDKARELMTEKIREVTAGADILKLKTDGGFTESGYRMKTEIVYSRNIAEDIPFEVEK